MKPYERIESQLSNQQGGIQEGNSNVNENVEQNLLDNQIIVNESPAPGSSNPEP